MGASPPLSRHLLLVRPKADGPVGFFYEGLKAEARGPSAFGDDMLEYHLLNRKVSYTSLTASLQSVASSCSL